MLDNSLKYCISFLVVFGSFMSAAQDVSKDSKGIGMFPAGNQSTFITYAFSMGNSLSHELRVEHFVHPRWSLIYSTSYSYAYSFGGSNLDDSYSEFRAPIGVSCGVGLCAVVAGSYTCGYSGSSGLGDLFVLSCMIPDGVAYHIPMGEKFDLSPYLNVSGLAYQWNALDDSRIVYSPMGGIRLLYPVSEIFIISAEQNFKRLHGGGIAASVGAGISVHF